MARSVLFAAVLGLFLGSLAASADDWPEFRGTGRTGVSKETGLLKAWPKEGPKLAWEFKNAGSGISSFAVVKGVVYTLGTRDEDEIVLALDAGTGKELWTAKIGPIFTFKSNFWGEGPRSTPTVDGNHLYALGAQGTLVCVDVALKGKEIWRKDMIKDFSGVMMTEWGYSESPLVDGAQLICTPGGKGGTLAALDKLTGALLWRTKEWTEKAPYSSAIAATIHGVRQYIQAGYTGGAKGGSLAGVDAKTGKLLWKQQIFKVDSYAIGPSAIVQGNKVYISTGMDGPSCHLYEINANQEAVEKYNKSKLVKNSHGGLVLLGEYLYGHSEKSKWICQEFETGELKWDETNVLSARSGAVTSAEGMVYLYSDEGEVGLLQATPKAFTLVSSFKLPARSTLVDQASSKQAKPWAYPVVANGLLLVRDLDLIFAFDIKAK